MINLKNWKQLLYFFLLLSSQLTQSQEKDLIEFERVLSLQAKNERLTYSNFLLSYEIDNNLYINTTEILVAVGFNLTEENGKVSFRWEDRSKNITIDQVNCYYEKNGRLTSFDCREVITDDFDYYINLNILSSILNSEFDYNERRSLLEVSSDIDFPTLKIERLKQNTVNTPSSREFNADRKIVPDYYWLDGFSLYQEIDSEVRRTRSKSNSNLRHFNTIDAEFLKHQLQVQGGGNENSYEINWFTLSKKDQNSSLLGPLNASTYQVGSVYTPSTRHIPSGGRTFGFQVNNKELGVQSQRGFETFEGELLPGWVVEIYRNNILLDRQSSESSDNRYRFDRVPLDPGLNRFQLIFYGPSGEEKVEVRSLYLRPGAFAKRPLQYDFVWGNDSGEQKLFIQSQVFLDNYTQFSLSHFNDSDNQIWESELITTLLNSSVSVSGAIDSDGSVYGGEIQKRLGVMRLSGEHFQYNNYQVNQRRLSQLTSLSRTSLAFPFLPRTQHLINYEYLQRETGGNYRLRYRNSHNFKKFFINNEILFENAKTTFKHFLRFRLSNWQLFSEFEHSNNNNLEKINLGVRHRVGRDQSFRASITKSYLENQENLNLSFQRIFSNFSLNTSFSTNFKDDSSITFGIKSSLFADPKNNYYNVRSRHNREIGDLFVTTHINVDGDKIPIRDVCINSLNIRETYCSNEQGIIRVTNLPTNHLQRIQLEFRNLENFYISSKEKYYEVEIRPGKTTHLKVPLVIFGEIEGIVSGFSLPSDQISIEIKNLKTGQTKSLRTDREGYFYLGQVTPGNYQSTLVRNGNVIEKINFIMPDDGDLIALDFKLK